MSYISLSYYIMVVLAVILYYTLPKKIRWIVLLFASCYFYYSAADNKLQLIVFGFSIIISYLSGIIIKELQKKKAG